MASRDRGRPLLARRAFSCLAAPALSKRDLAWFCVARGKLPLFGGLRLLALGISGLPRLYFKNHSARSIACLTIEWLSDNGSCYVAGDTRSFARDIGLEPRTTPLESPQSNGMAEAFVRTI